MTERTMPDGLSDERGLLDGWLEYYRETLLAKCEGFPASSSSLAHASRRRCRYSAWSGT